MSVNGGIRFFPCSNLANPPAGTQAGPPGALESAGVITPDQVIGTGPTGTPAPGGPGGEIRGQLH